MSEHESHEVHIDKGIVLPPWMKWVGGTAGVTVIGLAATLFWNMMTGGFDRYIEKLAENAVDTTVVAANTAELKELTQSVTQLASAVQTSQNRDAEFRTRVDARLRTVDERLETLTQAMLELSR